MGAFVLDMYLMSNMIVGMDGVGDLIWNLTHTVKLLVFKLCTIGFLVLTRRQTSSFSFLSTRMSALLKKCVWWYGFVRSLSD
jgi:hypothetical protein